MPEATHASRPSRIRSLLFLCVANSARSQMAEALARAAVAPGIEVYSAGSEPSRVHPLAVRAMAEIGLDIAGHRSKGLTEVPLERIDLVVTLCAEEVCPVFPRPVRRMHWPLPDPASTRAAGEEAMAAFRAVRDELLERIERLAHEERLALE